MYRVLVAALLVTGVSTGQAQGLRVSLGVVAPVGPDGLRENNGTGPAFTLAVTPLHRLRSLYLSLEGLVFKGQGGGCPDRVGPRPCSAPTPSPVLAAFAGVRVASSRAPTHVYFSGGLGGLLPVRVFEASPAPAWSLGVGLEHPAGPHLRVFEEVVYNRSMDGDTYSTRFADGSFGWVNVDWSYAAFRIGLSLN